MQAAGKHTRGLRDRLASGDRQPLQADHLQVKTLFMISQQAMSVERRGGRMIEGGVRGTGKVKRKEDGKRFFKKEEEIKIGEKRKLNSLQQKQANKHTKVFNGHSKD